jgi:hypothetical protein
VIALMISALASKVIRTVLNFAIRPDVGMFAVGMLDVPMEVVGIRGNMGLPFIVRRVEITTLLATGWIA